MEASFSWTNQNLSRINLFTKYLFIKYSISTVAPEQQKTTMQRLHGRSKIISYMKHDAVNLRRNDGLNVGKIAS